MKIRQGFVSNSSTTSFCIYGVSLEEWPKVDSPEYEEDPCEYWYDACNKLGLELHASPWNDGGWIGSPISDIGVDETRGQFQSKVDDKLRQLNIDPADACIHEEAWRDG